jgi:entericidin B
MKTLQNKVTLLALLTALVSAFALSGCNTVEGAGKDVEKGGEAIQKAAN